MLLSCQIRHFLGLTGLQFGTAGKSLNWTECPACMVHNNLMTTDILKYISI